MQKCQLIAYANNWRPSSGRMIDHQKTRVPKMTGVRRLDSKLLRLTTLNRKAGVGKFLCRAEIFKKSHLSNRE